MGTSMSLSSQEKLKIGYDNHSILRKNTKQTKYRQHQQHDDANPVQLKLESNIVNNNSTVTQHKMKPNRIQMTSIKNKQDKGQDKGQGKQKEKQKEKYKQKYKQVEQSKRFLRNSASDRNPMEISKSSKISSSSNRSSLLWSQQFASNDEVQRDVFAFLSGLRPIQIPNRIDEVPQESSKEQNTLNQLKYDQYFAENDVINQIHSQHQSQQIKPNQIKSSLSIVQPIHSTVGSKNINYQQKLQKMKQKNKKRLSKNTETQNIKQGLSLNTIKQAESKQIQNFSHEIQPLEFSKPLDEQIFIDNEKYELKNNSFILNQKQEQHLLNIHGHMQMQRDTKKQILANIQQFQMNSEKQSFQNSENNQLFFLKQENFREKKIYIQAIQCQINNTPNQKYQKIAQINETDKNSLRSTQKKDKNLQSTSNQYFQNPLNSTWKTKTSPSNKHKPPRSLIYF